jgi:hypothetical protein
MAVKTGPDDLRDPLPVLGVSQARQRQWQSELVCIVEQQPTLALLAGAASSRFQSHVRKNLWKIQILTIVELSKFQILSRAEPEDAQDSGAEDEDQKEGDDQIRQYNLTKTHTMTLKWAISCPVVVQGLHCRPRHPEQP